MLLPRLKAESLNFRPPLLVVIFALAIVSGCRRPNVPFQSASWKNDLDARPQMVQSLLADYDIVGMTRTDVHELLGSPTGKRDSVIGDRYVYLAGSDGVIDDMWLDIRFSADTVTDVRHYPD